MGAAPGRGLVLVVEDEAAIAEVITLYLRRDGYAVHVESDGVPGGSVRYWTDSQRTRSG